MTTYYVGTAVSMNGREITNLMMSDEIQITDLPAANANITISGTQLFYNGGSIKIDNLGPGRLIIRPISNTGVDIKLQEDAHNDFNGDGHSDILLRNTNGAIFDFLGSTNGGIVNNGDNSWVSVDNSWHVAGTGDFNGDGLSDILWRNDNGAIFDFSGAANGGVVNNGGNSWMMVDPSWQVAGVGDFNGDGRADILWRNTNGAIFDFLGTTNGGFVNNGDNSWTMIDNSWHIVGVGDYNADGIDDILWQNNNGTIMDWLGTPNGGFVPNSSHLYTTITPDWHIQDPFF